MIPTTSALGFILRAFVFCLLPATIQVDSEDFDALTECIADGDFDKCEQVLAGDEDGVLVNPLGGLAFDMAGPAGYVCVEKRPDVLSSCVFQLNEMTGSLSPLFVMTWALKQPLIPTQYSVFIGGVRCLTPTTNSYSCSVYRGGRARSALM